MMPIKVPPGSANSIDRESRARADYANVRSQRCQARLEERTRAAEEAARLLATLADPRAKLAAEMATKFQSGF